MRGVKAVEAKSGYGVGNMSGIVRKKLVGNIATDFQRFTADGTWTKPSGVSVVWIEVYGAGGGGGGGAGGGSGTTRRGASAGGGGAMAWGCFSAAALPATLAIVAGAGGNAGAGGSSAVGVTGVVGGNSDASGSGFVLKAFGGGPGGEGGVSGVSSDAGGGGGVLTPPPAAATDNTRVAGVSAD